MKISDVTILGQGDRALILILTIRNIYLYLEKILELYLPKLKRIQNKTSTLEKVFEKRLMNEKI